MRKTVLDSATKEALRKAVRGLRERLLESLGEATESEYRLQTSRDKAKLPADRDARRQRLEDWLDEQVRATPTQQRKTKKAEGELRLRFRKDAVKEAAYTLLHRLVFVRILEHHGLMKPALISGGWESAAYRDEFVHYSQALQGDDTRGYAPLLDMLYAELALDLPGLFGPVGLTQLIPVPAATLREVVEALNDKALDQAWGDDTTLGWLFQFANDPEREALDAKISDGEKIEPHEIGPKTQMFTERYMVEWLLQNSLGQTWLALCRRNGWTPDFYEVRDRLEARRADWRKRREAGDVALDALMPLESELEERWKYWVPQPLLDEAVESVPTSIRELKLLDPACGSGHFLVIAFDLLAALYEEEDRHRGERADAEQIARSIVENNLHGIDIDPRAVQIAAAGLWLKAKLYAPQAELRAMNLVAPAFRLSELPKNDPAFERLCAALDAFPISRHRKLELTDKLKGVDHLGTLLQVDQEIETVLAEAANELRKSRIRQLDPKGAVRRWFAEFLDAHSARAELGLRLDGEQVAAGVRFLEIVRDGAYDVVVGNPPYQGTSKLADAASFKRLYPRAKADLYACFLERSLVLTKPGGVSALLTMRGWMFLSQFQELREELLREQHLALLGDVDRGAFEDIPDEVVSTTMSIFVRCKPGKPRTSLAIQPTPLDDRSRDAGRTARKRAGLLAHVGRYEFDVAKLAGIEGTPLVYWWDETLLESYVRAPKLADIAPPKKGACTSDNSRFLRVPSELPYSSFAGRDFTRSAWAPYILGARSKRWFEPLDHVINWDSFGLEVKSYNEYLYGSYTRSIQNQDVYFRYGVAFSTIGDDFSARAHRYASVIDTAGSSVYPVDIPTVLCGMNSTRARNILSSLNPTVNFKNADVERLPLEPFEDGLTIFRILERSFSEHEACREQSIEFKAPGDSSWAYAQAWAQRAVDRAKGDPLPSYEPECDAPDRIAHLSFAIGVALGRFGTNGEGILAEAPATALPAGILYISGSDALPDSLSHTAAGPIEAAWTEHAAAILKGSRQDLRDWLRKDFFTYHKKLYENRPIYLPLSSSQKSIVAFVSIHRWTDNTLQTLLADHLKPNLRRLDESIADLNQARASSDRKAASGAERQYTQTKKLRDELADFIAKVTECAERGAPPTGPGCPPRDADAPFHMDLDDGVMINSAALWPLLEPQWKDPKKWWKELCEAKGRKDYDWAHLARRYFPERVDDKCRQDPSLAVAHGCFWKYHPAKAFAWELRLAHEIGPEFAIDELDAAEHRAQFLKVHAEQADQLRQKERDRREKLRRRQAEGEEETDKPGVAKGLIGEPPEDDSDADEAANDDEQVAV